MAVFGAPRALEDHAERALHVALAMQSRLDELFEGQLELRIGVNTGEIVVGPVRAGGSFVSGDTVNVAARLEQGAEPGEILVGERTVAAARGAFEFEMSAEIDAKRKPEKLVAHRPGSGRRPPRGEGPRPRQGARGYARERQSRAEVR
jgi:class 3 adenylate cyclase